MAEWGVLDIENVGDPWDGLLVAVGWRDTAYREPLPDHVLAELADARITKVTFTAHDHRWLGLRGYKVAGPWADVQTMAWTVDENMNPLDLANVSRRFGNGVTKDERIKKRGGRVMFRCDDGTEVPLEEAPWEQVKAYCEQDLASTAASYENLLRVLTAEGLDGYWLSDVVPLSPVLVRMMLRGMPVNVEEARAMRDRLAKEIATADAELKEEARLPESFNLNSSDQLGRLLYHDTFYEKRTLRREDPVPEGFEETKLGRVYRHGQQRLQGFGFKPTKWTDGCRRLGSHRHSLDTCKPSTDAKVLRVHHGDDLWVQTYLDMSARRTVVDTFLDTIIEKHHNGRIYGQFVQTGTVTGRLSSRGPNLQNQPSKGALGREVRSLYRPEPGWVFIHGDYSQLEPRIMAALSGDPVLMDIFQNGEDVYLRTAQEVYHEPRLQKWDPRRSAMKVYVLALGYGAQPKTLRDQLAIAGHFMPLHEVEDTFDRITKVYARLFEYREEVIKRARSFGYVDTMGGHRRHILFGRAAQGWTKDHDQGREGRQAANSEVQGTAAEIVGRAMVALDAYFGGDPRLLVQVHDELVMEARRGVQLRHPNLLEDIARIATTAHGFDMRGVPLVFEPKIVPTWAEGKD